MSTNAVGSDWLSLQLEKCRRSPSATLLSREEDAKKLTTTRVFRYPATRPKNLDWPGSMSNFFVKVA